MKKTILLSLMLTTNFATSELSAGHVGWGISPLDHASHINPTCCDPAGPKCQPCIDATDTHVTIWLDPGLELATALDAAATYSQQERSIDAKDALAELEESLSSGCSGDGSSGEDSSLTGMDSVPVAPEMVLTAVDGEEAFESVRTTAEDYLFEKKGGDCDKDCVLERQNTWLLTSLSLAASTSDKLLNSSSDMSEEYQALLSDFNGQTSPKGMWGSSSKITLHTHVQQNDINALYARDLEMNALNGVRESKDTFLLKR